MSPPELALLPQVDQVAATIQLSIAPVFLLAGLGGVLNVLASRLARVIDRARAVEALILSTRGAEHDRYVAEIRTLDRRIRIVNQSIFFAVLSALLICCVVVLLFAAELSQARLGSVIAALFMGSMVSLAIGLAMFLIETRIGSRTIQVRNELLYHQADPERE